MNNQENPNPNKPKQEQVLPREDGSAVENQEAVFKNEAERILSDIEATANQSVEAALDTAKIVETSQLPAEHKTQLRNRLKRSLKKLFRTFTFATALTGAAGVANYALTRYSVKPEANISYRGRVLTIYAHQDKETTHIIEVLSGKAQLSDSDKKNILLDYLTDELKAFHEEGEYEGIDENDLNERSLTDLMGTAREFMNVRGDKQQLITDPNPETFDPELYDALWKLEQVCGNPKVRFRLGGKKSFFQLYNAGRNFYNPYTNTVFIDIGDNEVTVDNYIVELSHGKQFNENPISSNILALKGIVKAVKGAIVGENVTDNGEVNRSVDNSYEKLYEEPGTLEHDAHQVIQPKLRSELENLTPMRTAQKRAEQQRQEQITQQIQVEIKKIEEEEKKKLNEAQDAYFKERFGRKVDLDVDKLSEEYGNNTRQIQKDFLQKKMEVYKRFGR